MALPPFTNGCSPVRQTLTYYNPLLPYSNQLMITGVATAPYTFAWSGVGFGSAVTDGFTFSASGLIGGTPTRNGTYNITATVTDSKGCKSVQDFLLTINVP